MGALGAFGRSYGRASEGRFSLLWEGQAERPAVRRPRPPAPKGCFGRQPEPTHYNEKGGKYERESQKKSDPEYPPDTG